MELVTKAVVVLLVIAILVLLITPAPDELPGLLHKHRVSAAVALPQAPTSFPASIATTVVRNQRGLTLVSSSDLLAVMCTRLC